MFIIHDQKKKLSSLFRLLNEKDLKKKQSVQKNQKIHKKKKNSLNKKKIKRICNGQCM